MGGDHQVDALDAEAFEVLDDAGVRVPAVDENGLAVGGLDEDGVALANVDEVDEERGGRKRSLCRYGRGWG
jgi:hypothetical protein